jgi:DNA-binding response OmpR family regulator
LSTYTTAKGHFLPAVHPPKPQILVVDDNRTVTRAMSVLIRDAGFEPVACHTGAEAIHHTDGALPSAAVVDIHLPDINGLILSQKLRERLGPDAPIVVVSGDTSMETLKSLPHVGATYFFPKPVSSSQLIARLKQLLEERGKDVA